MSNPNQPPDVQPPADPVTTEQLSEAEAKVAEGLQEELCVCVFIKAAFRQSRRRSAHNAVPGRSTDRGLMFRSAPGNVPWV